MFTLPNRSHFMYICNISLSHTYFSVSLLQLLVILREREIEREREREKEREHRKHTQTHTCTHARAHTNIAMH